MMSTTALHVLAEKVGIARDWTDANDKPQQVADDVLRQVLIGLGHPAENDQAVRDSLERLEQAATGDTLAPLLTVVQDQVLELDPRLAGSSPVRITLEDGSSLERRIDERGRLHADLPLGYHQVDLAQHSFTLAVTPARCYSLDDAVAEPPARCWGIAVQLYSLRRQGGGGYGDSLALEQLARRAAERGADALAISPVHALSSMERSQFSPYSPSSRLLLNTLYASPSVILGERAMQLAIEASGLQATLRELEAQELVDWPRAAEARHQLFKALYKDFNSSDQPLREDFDSFRIAAGQALELHCRFEVLQAQAVEKGLGADWRQWPADWQDPASPTVQEQTSSHPSELEFHAFCQWLTERSLQRAQEAARGGGMAVGLIADLAVGADGAGSQAWSRQDELLADLTVGAPPDILNRCGQDWGISAFSPEGLKRNGYRAFIEMLRANFAHAGGLRIDHVMGLRRLWLIPRGCKPDQGAYVELPLQDLLRLLALESVRHKAIVLGEDLGTVPDGLREALAEKAILGMRVLQFEQDSPGQFLPVADWPDDALATTGTHDLPTLAGWLERRDIDWQKRLCLIDEAAEKDWRKSREIECEGLQRSFVETFGPLQDTSTSSLIDAAIRYVGQTRAPLVLIPLEDLLGCQEQPNLPGTTEGHPNWRRRFDRPVIELPDDVDAMAPADPLADQDAMPRPELLDDEDAARRIELLAQAREQAWERDRAKESER